jgi:hypothetical protein
MDRLRSPRLLWATIGSPPLRLDLALLQNLPHGLDVDLFDMLVGHLRISLTGGDRGMPEQLPNRDDLRPLLEQVRGKRIALAMAARGHAVALA